MKKIILLSLILGVAFFASCSSSDEDKTPILTLDVTSLEFAK